MTISHVPNFPLAVGQGGVISSLTVAPRQVGDILIFDANTDATAGTAITPSGGGVSTWKRVPPAIQSKPWGGSTYRWDRWWGEVTTAGSQTLTITWTGFSGGSWHEAVVDSFSSDAGGGWGLDVWGITNTASGTSVKFPSLTPTSHPGATMLYQGWAAVTDRFSAGTTAGFTYETTSEGNGGTFNPSVSSGIAYAPTGVDSKTGGNAAFAGVWYVSGSPPPPPPPSGVVISAPAATATATMPPFAMSVSVVI